MTEVPSCPHVSKTTRVTETDVVKGFRFFNLTDKSIVVDDDGERFIIVPAVSLLPIVDNVIPPYQENVVIIVHKDIAAAYKLRTDVCFPGDDLGEYYSGYLQFCLCCIENDDKEKTD